MNGAAMLDLGRALWGTPNMRLSTREEARFGANGSKCIKLSECVWHDHEANEGGGYRDLYKRVHGVFPAKGTAADTIAAIYDYRDETGALLFQVVRKIPKTFRQRRPDVSGPNGWTWNTSGVRRVPYRLPELLAAPGDATVYIPEGEKDVDNLRALGLTATCNAGGAGKWTADLSPHLRGRHVVILPDNDDPGRDHAARLAASLRGQASSIRVLALPGLPEKGDASDWVAAGGTATELERLAGEAPEQAQPEPESKPGRAFGRLRVLSVDDAMNAPPRTYLLDGLMAPGELSVWWGKPKCGKSFLMLRLAYGMSKGRGIWGREASAVPVVYVAAEGEGGVMGRLRPLLETLGPAPDFHLIAQSVDLFDPDADLSDLIDAAKALGVKLIVLDTLARVMGEGDENSTRDMNAFVRNCDSIREGTAAPSATSRSATSRWTASRCRSASASALASERSARAMKRSRRARCGT